MKKTDLKGLSVEEIQSQVAQEKDRLVKLKFAHAITPIENPQRIKETRRSIARLLTEKKKIAKTKLNKRVYLQN